MSFASFAYRARRVVRGLFLRAADERDMQREMADHLARAEERYRARGLSEIEARDAARREFGNVAVLQEEGRDARGARWIESIVADLRFATRQIRHRPLSSATIVAVLALGIAIHAGLTVFFDAVTARPNAGVEASPALVRLRGKVRPREGGRWYPRPFSYPEYQELADRRDLFSMATAWSTGLVSLDFGDPDQAETINAFFITGDYFETAGSRIQLGTTLPLPARADGGGGEMAAVISDGLWRQYFGGAPDVIGKSVRVNETPVRIVGVADRRFNGITGNNSMRNIWLPLASRATLMRTTRVALVDRDSALLAGAARLAPGVELERASRAVQLLSEQAVARATPPADKAERSGDVAPMQPSTSLPEDPEMGFVAALFSIGSLLIILIVCTNLSALVVGSGVARSQEIAIRLSLGASRWRIIRQLITESCVLAVAGGAAGLALYVVATRVLATAFPSSDITLDWKTATISMVIALGTGVVFGLSPALHATKVGVGEVMKSGGAAGGASSRTRLQSWFVIGQIAITQPLLVGVAIMIGMVIREGQIPIAESVATRVLRLSFESRDMSPLARAHFRAGMNDLLTLPGVEQVMSEPDGSGRVELSVLPDSRSGLLMPEAVEVSIEESAPGYFRMLDIPLIRGRDVAFADTVAGERPVVIGSNMAHELWGNADPIGRRFSMAKNGKSLDRTAVVVGVYDATRGTTSGKGRRIYAADNSGWRESAWLVRTTGPARPLARAMIARLRKTTPEMPVEKAQTLQEYADEFRRLTIQLGGGAIAGGALVLLLASIGLYGVIGLAVGQRRREIGIRMALGAKSKAVVGMLFRQGLRLGAIGLAIGLPLSVGLITALAAATGGQRDGGPLPINPYIAGAGIAAVVMTVTALATWLPARRGAKVDPLIALRAE